MDCNDIILCMYRKYRQHFMKTAPKLETAEHFRICPDHNLHDVKKYSHSTQNIVSLLLLFELFKIVDR